MPKRYNKTILALNAYTTQTRQHRGVPHMVVPLVMMVEGVHAGSHGPMLYQSEELATFPNAWNGVPVVVMHPEENGNNISANSPEVLDNEAIGIIFNTQFVDGKLKAQAWINVERCSEIAPNVLEDLRAGRPMEISTGMFTEDEIVSGEYNGITYNSIAHNYRPDHLALLPGATGACSIEAGCGVRANASGGEDMKRKTGNKSANLLTAEQLSTMKTFAADGVALQANAIGNQELSDTLQAKLDLMDTDLRMHFLEEVFDGYFIYRVRERSSGGSSGLYRREYTTSADEVVEITGEPIAVRRQVDYINTPQTNKKIEDGKDVTIMADKKACCPEKVEALIANANTPFQEADREELLTFNQEMIEKLSAMGEVNAPETTAPETAAPVMNQADAIKVLQEAPLSQDQFLNLMPAPYRESFMHGQELSKKHREGLITQITTNTSEYTPEELGSIPVSSLEKLARAVTPAGNYTAAAGTPSAMKTNADNNGAGAMLLPPGVE